MQDKKVIEELRRIETENGRLLPADIVKAAKSPTSILHGHFEWNDGEAAHKYRLDQARDLIRVCVEYVGSGESKRKVNAFVSLTTDRSAGGGYRTMTHVLAMDNLRAQLVEDAILDMNRFRAKYASVSELASVFAAMDEGKTALQTSSKKKRSA